MTLSHWSFGFCLFPPITWLWPTEMLLLLLILSPLPMFCPKVSMVAQLLLGELM